MIKKVLKKAFVPLVLYGGLAVFLFNTDPHTLQIGWLLIPFVWLFVALLLDSINQLTIRDGLLLIALGAVGLFYASKVNFRLVE